MTGGARSHVGWVTVPPSRAGEGNAADIGTISYSLRAGHLVLVARSQHVLNFVEQDHFHDPCKGCDPSADQLSGRRAARRADYLAGQSAEAISADLFVTRRLYLLEQAHRFARGVDCMAPEQAVTVVGLYLRCRGEFVVALTRGGGCYRLDKSGFYRVATRALLPAAWRYFSACVRADSPDLGASALYLAQSVLQRLDRALRQRDAIHWSLNQPQDNNTADDTAVALDSFLQLMVGAFDAAARVAHLAAGMPPSDLHQVGWQKRQWRAKLRQQCSGLAALMEPGTPGDKLFLLLRLLRNSVHGEALQTTAVHGGVSRESTMIGLPTADMEQLLASMDVLGGQSSWGVGMLRPQRTYLDPGLLVDRLVPEAAVLLDKIMDSTPVERLSTNHVALVADAVPDLDADRMFSPANKTRVLLQLGL